MVVGEDGALPLPWLAEPLAAVLQAQRGHALLLRAAPGVASGSVVEATRLNNADASVGPAAADQMPAQSSPCVAAIYQLDGLVRRAASLQLTSDARGARA